jgi:hypothetical protein
VLTRVAGGLARPGWIGPAIAATGAALLVGLLPDRTRFVGDFLVRQGTVEYAVAPARVWPQALPLDAWLHYRLPLWLTAHHWTDANGAARALGMLEVAALATLAIRFARRLELRRDAAFAAGCVVFFGGALGLFTGYGKAFVELAVLTAWIGVAGLSLVRVGRGRVELAIAFTIALLLHRSALGFLPALLAAWMLAARDQAPVSKRQRLVSWGRDRAAAARHCRDAAADHRHHAALRPSPSRAGDGRELAGSGGQGNPTDRCPEPAGDAVAARTRRAAAGDCARSSPAPVARARVPVRARGAVHDRDRDVASGRRTGP